MNVANALHGRFPEDVRPADPWHDDLVWLLTNEEDPVPMQPAASQFINSERHDFQPECGLTDRVLISEYSDINSWTVIWSSPTRLNYLSFDQG